MGFYLELHALTLVARSYALLNCIDGPLVICLLMCPQVPPGAEVTDVHFESITFTVPEVSWHCINLITEPDIYPSTYNCMMS